MFNFKINLLITSLLASIVIFSFNYVEAKKIDKVEICHWNESKQIYKKITVVAPAKEAHFRNHNDIEIPPSGDCNSSEVRVFALAYIDVDQNGSFDELVDVLISKLEDTNGDNVINAGDVLTQGNYPLNHDPCPAAVCSGIGSFNLTQHILDPTDVVTNSVEGVTLQIKLTTLGLNFLWGSSPEFEDFFISDVYGDVYIEFADVIDISLDDSIDTFDFARSVIDASFFNTKYNTDPQDNYFVNIELDNPSL